MTARRAPPKLPDEPTFRLSDLPPEEREELERRIADIRAGRAQYVPLARVFPKRSRAPRK